MPSSQSFASLRELDYLGELFYIDKTPIQKGSNI